MLFLDLTVSSRLSTDASSRKSSRMTWKEGAWAPQSQLPVPTQPEGWPLCTYELYQAEQLCVLGPLVGPTATRRPGAEERVRTGLRLEDTAPDRDLRRHPPQHFRLSLPRESLGWGLPCEGSREEACPQHPAPTAPGPTGLRKPRTRTTQDHPGPPVPSRLPPPKPLARHAGPQRTQLGALPWSGGTSLPNRERGQGVAPQTRLESSPQLACGL